MGNSNSKNIHVFLQNISENSFKEKELYSELLNLDENFQNGDDFYLIKKFVDNSNNITFLFKFLMNTLSKVLQDTNNNYLHECKICIRIFLCIFPVVQYNYNKKEIINLMWKKDYFENLIEHNYICNNILILHIFNFLLILLFTENVCIKKGNNKSKMVLVKNIIDINRLWFNKFLIHGDTKYNDKKFTNLNLKNKNDEYIFNDVSYIKKKNKNGLLSVDKLTVNDSNFKYLNNNKEKYELNNNKNILDSSNEKIKKCAYAKDSNYVNYSISEYANSSQKKRNTEILYNDISLELIKNRIDILKCLLILLSSYMYFDDKSFLKKKNLYLFLFSSGEIYFTANFFLSLLNTVFENEFNYFNFFFYNDTYLEFYNLCIIILNILINFNPFTLKNKKKVHYMNSAAKFFYKSKKYFDSKKGNMNYNKNNKENEKKNEKKNEYKIDIHKLLNNKKMISYIKDTQTNENKSYNNITEDLCVKKKKKKSAQSKNNSENSHRNSSSFETIIYKDIYDESCSSSSRNIENSNNENINSDLNKNKTKFNNLESELKKKSKYIKREKKKSNYIYLKNKNKIENFYCNNVFLEMLCKLELNNIKHIYNGTLNILISYKLYIENYNENLPFIGNYLCLLWNIMNNNNLFISYMKKHNSNIFLFYILYILLCLNNHRKNEMQELANTKKNEIITINNHNINEEKFTYNNENFNHSNKCREFNIRVFDGLIYICLFIILKISSKSTICKNLNQKYDQKIKLNFLKNINQFNNYVDFLVFTLYTLINDNIYFLKFERIIDMCITILTNVSVYIKSMNTYSCEYIINILKKILKKEWILSSQNHFYSLFLLLDFINNILSYNLYDNYNLIYMIIKNKDVFFSIHNLHDVLKNNYLCDSKTFKDYWIPTESWLINWKNKLPLHFINSIIYDLANLIEEECDEKEILNYDEAVNLIKNHCLTIENKKIPFIIRKYEKNILLSKWFTNYLYFLIFFHTYKQNLFINNGIKFIF
ncbi:conserved Plasmodium protein, unknown function [Plasmodium gallinaceum]|uniref:HID1 domain-containing protein n=1 Tax=Plasmodium gallinaceum TaxID=5849 RepID=A0A1J1GTM2_PLAGA|nr:conserved Plasmodium protein, unknown function [Plasmodium gallinaceum]CRG95834.1 conserved Plasmodium protein, unknown function [Plasmodium gallinaceum]